MTELQKCILSIFTEVKKFCEENDISYYAIGGTCLGAVRHGGFIPWDDDLDIAIPVEQMERFVRLAKKKLPEHLELVSYHTHPHFPRMFVRVTDKRTTYVQTYMMAYPDEYHGVFIDVMPMTGKPEGLRGRLFAHEAAVLDYVTGLEFSTFRQNRKLRERLSWLAVHALFFLNGHMVLRFWEKELKKHPVKGAKEIIYAWNAKSRYRSFPAELFEPSAERKFEEGTIRCPGDTDRYLKIEFGDYMKLPPPEKQVGHHDGHISLRVPCRKTAETRKRRIAARGRR
ncbi:MAG: LicD family protein [Lachnospiraceae bacterium]|nr:LicD family protein [Lachnospiraceae bacterium]